MVNVWEHLNFREEAASFCRTHNIADGAAVLIDETSAYAEKVGLRGVPFNLMVDEAGIVVAAGATTPAEVMETLSVFLGEEDGEPMEAAPPGPADDEGDL